jgi:hypothetical protein
MSELVCVLRTGQCRRSTANAISYLITTMKQANSKRFDEDFSIAYLESVVAPVSAIIDRIRTNQQRSLDDPI